MNILVLGDSFCPAGVLRSTFDGLQEHSITYSDVVDEPEWRPSTSSETKIAEVVGSPEQVIAALRSGTADFDVLVVQGVPITDAVFAAAPALRLICVLRGGPVNVDTDAATACGIPVVTTPGKNAIAVAELTMALVVMLARRIPEAVGHVNTGGEVYVDNYEGANWFGQNLAGKTLGLVGFGQVGSRVAVRALAFDMRVEVFDPFVANDVVSDAGAKAVSLGDLLRDSDFVSLHARATPENDNMIGAEQFASMKRGTFFINAARNSLVDEDALDAALRSDHLGGAALDLASPSLSGRRHRLLASSPNVVLLPHIGGATHDTLRIAGQLAVAEIVRFSTGQELANVANPTVLSKKVP